MVETDPSACQSRLLTIPIERVDELVRLTEDLRDYVASRTSDTELQTWLSKLEKGVWNLQLVGLSSMPARFREMVQELSLREGREVKIEFSGFQLSVSHAVAEVLSLIFIHGIRNSLAHGIESPAERQVAGKEPQGTIRAELRFVQGRLKGTLQDDGRGPTLSKIIARAVAMGLVSTESATKLSEAETLSYLFAPRLSTATQATELSGLGMGLEAIQSAVRSQRGSLVAERRTDLRTHQPSEGFRLLFDLPLEVIGLEVCAIQLSIGTFYVPASEVEKGTISEFRTFRMLDPVWKEAGPTWLAKWMTDRPEAVLATRVSLSPGAESDDFGLGILTDMATLRGAGLA